MPQSDPLTGGAADVCRVRASKDTWHAYHGCASECRHDHAREASQDFQIFQYEKHWGSKGTFRVIAELSVCGALSLRRRRQSNRFAYELSQLVTLRSPGSIAVCP